jgi:hypothetical protein
MWKANARHKKKNCPKIKKWTYYIRVVKKSAHFYVIKHIFLIETQGVSPDYEVGLPDSDQREEQRRGGPLKKD